jgi:hypothetical protein
MHKKPAQWRQPPFARGLGPDDLGEETKRNLTKKLTDFEAPLTRGGKPDS